MTKWVYGFGGGSADGDASMKNLLGGKGANLAEMSSLGLPVPPGSPRFTARPGTPRASQVPSSTVLFTGNCAKLW